MKHETSKGHSLKVRYFCEGKKKNKLFNITDMEFTQVWTTIFSGLSLDDKKYVVFYRDSKDKDKILYLNTQEDYELFLKTGLSLTVQLEEKQRDGSQQMKKEGLEEKKEEVVLQEMKKEEKQKGIQNEKQMEDLKAIYSMKTNELERTLGNQREEIDWLKAQNEQKTRKINCLESQLVELRKQNEKKADLERTLDDLRRKFDDKNAQAEQKTKNYKNLETQLMNERKKKNQEVLFLVQNAKKKLKEQYDQKEVEHKQEYLAKSKEKQEMMEKFRKTDGQEVQKQILKTKNQCMQKLISLQKEMKNQIQEKVELFIASLKCKRQTKFVHKNIRCSMKCSKFGNNDIIGVRYKCLQCPTFNLCEECEIQGLYEHQISHPLIKIYGDTKMVKKMEPEPKKEESCWNMNYKAKQSIPEKKKEEKQEINEDDVKYWFKWDEKKKAEILKKKLIELKGCESWQQVGLSTAQITLDIRNETRKSLEELVMFQFQKLF